MRFKHALALLGMAVLAAGYSTPGSYERLYFYYAYKLDQMTGGGKIAPGCMNGGKPCGFNEFIKFIQNDKAAVSITNDEFPHVAKTAKKLADEKLTGVIEIKRVVDGVKNDYTALLKKVGDIIQGVAHKPLSGEDTPARQSDLLEVKTNLREAMISVLAAREEAAVASFKPFNDFKVVPDAAGTAVDFEATVARNPGSTSKEQLEKLWAEHIQGKEPTAALVEEFKPFKDFQVATKEGGRKVDGTAMVKSSPGMTRKWLSLQWAKNVRGNHGGNIDVLRTTIEATTAILCGLKRSVLGKRNLGCSPLEEPLSFDGLAPHEGNSVVSAKEIEVAKVAERVSELEFAELANKHGLGEVSSKKWKMSLSEARTKLLQHKSLEPGSSRLQPGVGGVGWKLFGLAGGALWVSGVVEAFTHDVGFLNRAAAVTALVPFVGCGFATLAAVDNKQDTVITSIDSALCLLGDLLIFGGFPIPGMLLQFARMIIQYFTPPPKPPTKEEMEMARDGPWKNFLSEHIYTYMYSHDYVDPTRGFATKLEGALAVEALGVASESAISIGAVNASSQVALFGAGNDLGLDPAKLEADSQEAIEKIRAATSAEIARRHRNFLVDLPFSIRHTSNASLQATADKYNHDFIEKINSEEFIKNYPEKLWYDYLEILGVFAGGSKPTLPVNVDHQYTKALEQMANVGKYLQTKPPPMPALFDIAFVLGQSKGLIALPEALSPRDYIRDQVPGLPDAYIDMLAVRHAIDVVHLIQGSKKESELSDIFPTPNDQVRQRLQVLVALKCGKLYEKAKVERLNRYAGQPLIGVSLKGIINPLVPPIAVHPKSTSLYALILGLTQTVVEMRLEQSASGNLEEQTKVVKERFQGLRDTVHSDRFSGAVFNAARPSEPVSEAEVTKSVAEKMKRMAGPKIGSFHERRAQRL